VPAVLPVTQTNFVAYSSIVFAVLGLRALYFVLEGLVDRFAYLHYGLAAILVFLGTKFVAQGFGLQIPILATRGRRSGGGRNARGQVGAGS
jgi:tellurite resistance protein TerC